MWCESILGARSRAVKAVGAMNRLSSLFGRLFDVLAAIAALLLLAMVLLVTADIVLRNTARVGFPVGE